MAATLRSTANPGAACGESASRVRSLLSAKLNPPYARNVRMYADDMTVAWNEPEGNEGFGESLGDVLAPLQHSLLGMWIWVSHILVLELKFHLN